MAPFAAQARRPARAAARPVRSVAPPSAIDMGSGKLHQLDCRRIAVLACSTTSGASAPKSRGDAFDGAAHDGVGIALELRERGLEQRGPGRASVMRPQDAAQQLTAEPGAAALVRNRQSPAADAILTPVQLGPPDAAGADHDHAAVATPMRADAGRVRIGREHGAAERMLARLRRCQLGRLACPRERKAGRDPSQDPGRKDRPAAGIAGWPPALPRGSGPALSGCWRARLTPRPAGRPTARTDGRGSGFHRHRLPEEGYLFSATFSATLFKVNARERFRIEHVVAQRKCRFAHGYRTRQPPLFRHRSVEPGRNPRRHDRGAVRRGCRHPCRPAGAGARSARHGGTAALSRPADLCGRRHLRPAGGAGRRRADADLQLAGGSSGAADGGRQGGAAQIGRRRRGRGTRRPSASCGST